MWYQLITEESQGPVFLFLHLSVSLSLLVLWTLYISMQNEWKLSWSSYQKILLLKCTLWLCLHQWTKQGQYTELGNATKQPTLFDDWHPSQQVFNSCPVGPSLTLTVHSLRECSTAAVSNRQVDKLPPVLRGVRLQLYRCKLCYAACPENKENKPWLFPPLKKHHFLRKFMAKFSPALALARTAKEADRRIWMDQQCPTNRPAFYNQQNQVQAVLS